MTNNSIESNNNIEITELNAIDIYASELNQLRQRVADLESHRRRRTELEPAECPNCHKTFRNKYILKTHIENMHNENRQRHSCPHCTKTFASKYYLAKHINDKHSELEVISNSESASDTINDPITDDELLNE